MRDFLILFSGLVLYALPALADAWLFTPAAAPSGPGTCIQVLVPSTNWGVITEVDVYDSSGPTERLNELTTVNGNDAYTIDSIVSGQFTNNVTSGNTNTYKLNDNLLGNYKDCSAATCTHKVFGKWASAFTISKIEIGLGYADSGWVGNVSFQDCSGTPLTIATEPADVDDYFQNINASYKFYRWTF